jgi:hypothetical protein
MKSSHSGLEFWKKTEKKGIRLRKCDRKFIVTEVN